MLAAQTDAAAIKHRLWGAVPERYSCEHLAKYDAERSISLQRYLQHAQLRSAREAERERARILALAIDILVDDGAEPIVALDIRNIIDVVRTYYGVSLIDLRAPRKTKRILWARQSAMYLCRELTGATFHQIGLHLGDRDPTTCDHGWRKVSARLAAGLRPLCTEIDELKKILAGDG